MSLLTPHSLPISIHAPTRGATAFYQCTLFLLDISIHAPTRGATYVRIRSQRCRQFQSTLLQEERRRNAPDAACAVLFQSTLLQEERLESTGYTIDVETDFNPRSYKRSDDNCVFFWCKINYFNPRSYKRSDRHGPCECLQLYPYFNPRSYKRSDSCYNAYYNRACRYFNPRSYKRSDKNAARMSEK